jgi:hypothetical protein
MRKNPRRILSPQRLPFRHPGEGTTNLSNKKTWQNAATLSPLRICSEISLRHFVHVFLLRFRCVIAQLCYATTIFRKMRFT